MKSGQVNTIMSKLEVEAHMTVHTPYLIGTWWKDANGLTKLMNTDSLRDQHATSPPPIPRQQIILQKGPPGIAFSGNSTQINHSSLPSKTEAPQILPTSFS